MTTQLQPYRAISAHPLNQELTISANLGDENQLAKDWWFETEGFHDLFEDKILRYPKSAFALCPLRDGIRDNAHALPTQILALDFDDPDCSIEKVQSFFRDCDHVIYTTRSHRKEKKGVTCDRFRIVLPLDKQLDPVQLPSIVDWFGQVLGCDTCCKDGARFFYCGVADSLIYRHVFPLRLSVDWLLGLAPSEAPETSATASKRSVECPTINPNASGVEKRVKAAPLVLEEKPAHSKHVSFLRKAWGNCQDHDNTFEDVFAVCMLWIQEYGNNIAALKAALPKVEDIEDFYNRNPHQWKGINATLSQALNFVVNNKKNSLQHRNKVETVDCDALPLSGPDMMRCDDCAILTGGEAGDFEDTLKLIRHALTNHKKAIIDVQCGGGKSVVTSVVVAQSKDCWLIVKDTVGACLTERDRLLKFGVESTDIQVLRGWDKQMCEASLSELEGRKWGKGKRGMIQRQVQGARSVIDKGFSPFYSKVDSPCVECWARCDFRQSRTHRSVIKTLKTKRIVICTHARFLELAHWGTKALTGRRIVIDEEPALFEGVGFQSKELELIQTIFKGCLKGKVETHIQGLLNDSKTGSIADSVYYDRGELKVLQGRCSKLDPSSKEMCYSYLHFMAYKTSRFAFVEKDVYGKKLSLVRNRLNFNLPNDIYVLNASSRFALAVWEGFTVVRQQEQKRAEGVTLYAYPCNSTKHRLDKEASDYLTYALKTIVANGRKKVMLALNKEESQTSNIKQAVEGFKTECQKIGVEVMEGYRGSIIGRNDWRDCDAVILAYGLFTSVANLALKQSLVEGREIEGSRIWDTKLINGVEVRQPRMNKGIVDKAIRQTDRRLFADEVYQVGLRGVARNWKGQEMDIITTAPGTDYLYPVTSVLPGCKIVCGDTELERIETADLLQSDKELTKVFGMTDNAENRERAREMAQDILSHRLEELG